MTDSIRRIAPSFTQMTMGNEGVDFETNDDPMMDQLRFHRSFRQAMVTNPVWAGTIFTDYLNTQCGCNGTCSGDDHEELADVLTREAVEIVVTALPDISNRDETARSNLNGTLQEISAARDKFLTLEEKPQKEPEVKIILKDPSLYPILGLGKQ